MRRVLLVTGVAVLFAAGAIIGRAQGTTPSGESVYAKHCASCHDRGGDRVPNREALARMSGARILRTLDFGLMMSIAYPLRRDEREAVAHFLGRASDRAHHPCRCMVPIRHAHYVWSSKQLERVGAGK